MRFTFSRRFFILLALGFVPLSLSWTFPEPRFAVLVYDVLLILFALADVFISRRLPEEFTAVREFDRRFAIGDPTIVDIDIGNASGRAFHIQVKDEYPAEMVLNEPREAQFTVDAQTMAHFSYSLT